MKRRTALFVCCAAILGACATGNLNKDFTGTWAPQQAQLGGKEFPIANLNGAMLHLTVNSYEFAGDLGHIVAKSDAKPAQLDIYGTQGPNAGRTILAIYAVQGDELTVCYQLGDGPRPTEFVSSPGSMLFLVHYRRMH